MHILFVTSAHNSLSQRLEIELTRRQHRISLLVVPRRDDDAIARAAADYAPELIVAPMLKVPIPEVVWTRITCLIVHPGIIGDRGPSSLDWAIMNREPRWGVTVLQAAAEMDAGEIWASHDFALGDPPRSKSSLYRHEVTEAAVRGVLEAVERFASKQFTPRPLDYAAPDVRGQLRPPIKQLDRRIDWAADPTELVIRKIRAGDSAPGVLDDTLGRPLHLFGAHVEGQLRGAPGALIAQRHGAVCRATVDGAVWITHLRAKPTADAPAIKLPAVEVLGERARALPTSELPIDVDPGYPTWRELRYCERDHVGYLHFDFYNGAMNTAQCERLRAALGFARSRPTKAIALMGGEDFFSNGIDLNAIEAAASPARESWRNIHAINDVVQEVLHTMSHLVVACIRGNAGAGGAMFALAADVVYARRGIVLNPHYAGMGKLYGSEYWTYTLPRRVGHHHARELTEALRPIGTDEACALGMVDDAFGDTVGAFDRELALRLRELVGGRGFTRRLVDKRARSVADEHAKPLEQYREEELTRMWTNFFGPDPAYHEARRNFVFKGSAPDPAGAARA